MVVPFSAVTTMVIVLVPTESAIAPEVVPVLTGTPFTLVEASPCDCVGVTVSDVVALPTLAVYDVVPEVKAGDRVPLDSESAERSAFEDPARVTVTVYVCDVPICEVTVTVITLLPTSSATAPDAFPLVVLMPFTVTVAAASTTVGVTDNDVTELPTLAE